MDDRACCCPSRPVVRVLVPAIPSRPYRVLEDGGEVTVITDGSSPVAARLS